MNQNYPYDCLAIFSKPLNIEGHIVYGTLFNKEKEIYIYENRHRENCGIKYLDSLENYIRYLYSCDDYYNSENKIKEGIWSNQWGDSTISNWHLIDTFFNSEKVEYTLIEKEEPIQFNENETNDDWVLSQELIDRVKN